MTTKLILRDLEAMHQHYGIAQEEEEEEKPPPGAAASRRTYDLLEDLGQVGVLEEVGISLQRWAQLRGVAMEYALALREYLLQEEEQEANREGPKAVSRRAR
jgi:hypothetical protein